MINGNMKCIFSLTVFVIIVTMYPTTAISKKIYSSKFLNCVPNSMYDVYTVQDLKDSAANKNGYRPDASAIALVTFSFFPNTGKLVHRAWPFKFKKNIASTKRHFGVVHHYYYKHLRSSYWGGIKKLAIGDFRGFTWNEVDLYLIEYKNGSWSYELRAEDEGALSNTRQVNRKRALWVIKGLCYST